MSPTTKKTKVARKPRITQWSFSRWRDHRTCPARAKYKYVDKLDEGPAGKALLRGSRVHDECEAHIVQEKPLPPEAEGFAAEFKALVKESDLEAELEWAFDHKWHVTGWFEPDAWLRVKLDACSRPNLKTLRVIDYKTGRRRDIDELQIALYGLGAFCVDPKVVRVQVELWYLDQDEIQDHAYTRKADFEELRSSWLKLSEPLLTDTEFAPTPGAHCRWCAFGKSKGGPCKMEKKS